MNTICSQSGGDLENSIYSVESMIHLIARRYSRWLNGSVGYEDLISAGMYGVCRAFPKFKKDKGCKFTTFVYAYIDSEIRKAIHKSLPFSIPYNEHHRTFLPAVSSYSRNAIKNDTEDGVGESNNSTLLLNLIKSGFTYEHLETYMSNEKFIRELDYSVFLRMVKGMSYADMSLIEGRTKQAIHQYVLKTVGRYSKRKRNILKEVMVIGDYIDIVSRDFNTEEGVWS